MDVVEKPRWKSEDPKWAQGYRPATTWDGLEHVGYTGQWWEKPELEEEQFVPCVASLGD